MSEIKLRDFLPTDEKFVLFTWLNGLYFGNDWFKEINQDIYMDRYCQIIKNLMRKKTISIRCACLKSDMDVVLGYCVQQSLDDKNKIIHWIFVKPPFRKMNIATMLIEDDLKKVQFVTHLTKLGKSLKPKDWIFNPFLI